MDNSKLFEELDLVSTKLIKAKKDVLKLEEELLFGRASYYIKIRSSPQDAKLTEANLKSQIDIITSEISYNLKNAKARLEEFSIKYEVVILKIKYEGR